MIRSLYNTLRRFRDTEEGSMVVPFALWMPVFLGVILSGIEVGTLTMRHTALERALDETVREVRLATGTNYTHDTLKQSICDAAAILPDCSNLLKLEMIKLNIRQWVEPHQSADCVDTALEVNPARNFEYGRGNEMMMLRACFKFKPISPAGYLSSALGKDDQGYSGLVSYSAFVQEPS